jgi:hypothetical protein
MQYHSKRSAWAAAVHSNGSSAQDLISGGPVINIVPTQSPNQHTSRRRPHVLKHQPASPFKHAAHRSLQTSRAVAQRSQPSGQPALSTPLTTFPTLPSLSITFDSEKPPNSAISPSLRQRALAPRRPVAHLADAQRRAEKYRSSAALLHPSSGASSTETPAPPDSAPDASPAVDTASTSSPDAAPAVDAPTPSPPPPPLAGSQSRADLLRRVDTSLLEPNTLRRVSELQHKMRTRPAGRDAEQEKLAAARARGNVGGIVGIEEAPRAENIDSTTKANARAEALGLIEEISRAAEAEARSRAGE